MLLISEPIMRYIDLKGILCTFKLYINKNDAIITCKVKARKHRLQKSWNLTAVYKSIT
jgi:hypothetical protein